MNNYEYYFLLSKQMKKINYVGLIKKKKKKIGLCEAWKSRIYEPFDLPRKSFVFSV